VSVDGGGIQQERLVVGLASADMTNNLQEKLAVGPANVGKMYSWLEGHVGGLAGSIASADGMNSH